MEYTKASWAEVGKDNADYYLSLARKCKQVTSPTAHDCWLDFAIEREG